MNESHGFTVIYDERVVKRKVQALEPRGFLLPCACTITKKATKVRPIECEDYP
jgi:hypothetical protein